MALAITTPAHIRGAEASASPSDAPWTLQRALDHALAHNPDARLARARMAGAQAAVQEANAAFWPALRFQSSYTRTDNPMLVFGSILNQQAYSPALDFNDVPDTDDLNARGQITMPIYAGGRHKAARESARAESSAAAQDEAAVRNALAFEVARGFHTVVKTREFIRAAEAAVVAYDTNLSTANTRLEAGSLLKTDVLDLQVRLAQAREDLLRARNANALATRALRNLLGLEEAGAPFNVAEDSAEPEPPAPAAGTGYQSRPELAAARLRERAAEERVRAARSGYLPRLSAFGSLDYDYGWKFDEGGGSYTAGGLLQWDLWDGQLTRAKVSQARADLDSAREQNRKVRLALDFEAEQARLDLQAATERVTVTRQGVEHARESAELTRQRFQQGSALSTQLMDAETALLAARVRLAEAEADRRIAVAAVKKASGG